MTLLGEAGVRRALGALPGWSGDASSITRTVEAPSFLTGIRIVSDVADAAEDANHHPDIDIRWTKVTFMLSSHSEGGVTAADIDLAERIDDICLERGAS